MYTCQLALINHIANEFKTPTVKTLRTYAGDLRRENVARLTTTELPAVFIMYIDGQPIAQNRRLQQDVLVLTESRSFDRDTNQSNNLLLTEQLCDYFKDNPFFGHPGRNYWIDPEQTRVKMLAQDGRFTLTAISIWIKDNRP